MYARALSTTTTTTYFYSTFLFVPGIAFIDVVFPVAF